MRTSRGTAPRQRRGAKVAQHDFALPSVVMAPAGPVSVRRVRLADDRCGQCKLMERVIEIDTDPMAATTLSTVFWHEWMHAVLWDCGVKLEAADAERVCDAVGLAMTVLSREA